MKTYINILPIELQQKIYACIFNLNNNPPPKSPEVPEV